ncbi:hypothetical protein Tco_0138919 [Tanacetum coccineum]
MFVFFVNTLLQNTMAEQNAPSQPPTRTDEHILPRSQWLIIGKSNLLFNAQKIQKNPIFQISVDILSNTNFFQAFTASASVPVIYLQQFWNTMKYDEKTGVYRCQIDEQWFDLSADLLRKALAITPIIPAQLFELPPSGNTVIDFVNELGYPEPIEIISNIRIPSSANVVGNRHDKLMVDLAELLWEDLLRDPDIFLTQSKSQSQSEGPKEESNSSPHSLWTVFQENPSRKCKRATCNKAIYYLASNNNIHRRPDSAVHHTGDDYILGNLKFVPKGESVEVFGMAIPDPLITEAIQRREDDDPDLELAKKLSRAPVGGVTIRDPVSEATPKLHEVVGKGKAVVTEEQVPHSLIDLSKKKRTTDQFILARRDQTHHDSTTGPSSQPEDDTSEKVIHESSSTSDSERTESETEAAAPKGDKDQDEVDTSTVTSGVSIPASDPEKAHEALAGPDPEPMKEDQTGSDSGKLHVSLAGPNPEHMDDEFLATAYPKVHENLKLITDERVIDDKPESQSGSMSSMKNLDDTFNFGDQFLYDKPTEDDQEKSKVREESDSTIPDPSHQTVTSTPPVIAPFTDVSSTKPSSLVTPPPINTEATTITTSLPEITPFIALQLRVARLEQEMSEVKKTDHQADVLASIKSQVPTAVDKYLGTKLDDALLKILERHTADLIEKYSVLPGPESVKNQESEKSPKEIIRAKKEQDEEKQDSTYSIRSTDKVDLEEFDLKSALFNHMNKKKSANRNTANYHLYHALMEALIADEDAMDKEVADKVKDHKRKHDSDDDEDDDDDEGPSAGSNQGRSTKKRRSDSMKGPSAGQTGSKSENKGKVPTEMELVLEQTQQGSSHKVSVSADGVEELKRIVKIKGVKKEALHTLRQKPAPYTICCQESLRMIADIEDRHHGPSDAMHNPP